MRRVSLFVLALLVPLAVWAKEPAARSKPVAATAAAGSDVMMRISVTTSSAEAKAEFMKGRRAADVGHPEEARAHFAAAVKADPSFALAYLGATFVAPSVESFSTNLKSAAGNAANASEAERAWIQAVQKSFANDGEGALKASQQLTKLAPDSPRAWMQLGGAQTDLGHYEDARASFRKAIAVAPGFAAAHAALGNSYLFSTPKDFAKAEESMRKVVALEPKEAQSHDFMGDVYRAESKLEQARDSYTRAAGLDPKNAQEPQQRGHANTFLGHWDEARADYDKAASLAQDNERANFGVYRALVS